jgi:hypothetical protein
MIDIRTVSAAAELLYVIGIFTFIAITVSAVSISGGI